MTLELRIISQFPKLLCLSTCLHQIQYPNLFPSCFFYLYEDLVGFLEELGFGIFLELDINLPLLLSDLAVPFSYLRQ